MDSVVRQNGMSSSMSPRLPVPAKIQTFTEVPICLTPLTVLSDYIVEHLRGRFFDCRERFA
jgi:hypothetical protein